jgi:hypothetical protein
MFRHSRRPSIPPAESASVESAIPVDQIAERIVRGSEDLRSLAALSMQRIIHSLVIFGKQSLIISTGEAAAMHPDLGEMEPYRQFLDNRLEDKAS